MSKETRNVRTPCLLGDKCKPKYLMNVTTVAHRSPSTVTRRVFIACWIQSKSKVSKKCVCAHEAYLQVQRWSSSCSCMGQMWMSRLWWWSLEPCSGGRNDLAKTSLELKLMWDLRLGAPGPEPRISTSLPSPCQVHSRLRTQDGRPGEAFLMINLASMTQQTHIGGPLA